MKKSFVLLVVLLMAANMILSSCGSKMYAKSAYRNGQHGTRFGFKIQVQAKRSTKHFWF